MRSTGYVLGTGYWVLGTGYRSTVRNHFAFLPQPLEPSWWCALHLRHE